MTDPNLARGAFALAMRGLAVFELIPGDKRPLRSGGYKTASNDPDVTRARWAKKPRANIGIACAPALETPRAPYPLIWRPNLYGAALAFAGLGGGS